MPYIYSFNWYKRFADGDFSHGKRMADFMATAISRMAEAPVPPFEFTRLAAAFERYWKEVEQLGKGSLPSSEMQKALAALSAQARDFEAAYVSGKASAASAVAKVERALLMKDGLPGRSWYKSAYSAPGQYTGYGAKTLPGVREALELNRPDEAARQAAALIQVVNAVTAAIGQAARGLRG